MMGGKDVRSQSTSLVWSVFYVLLSHHSFLPRLTSSPWEFAFKCWSIWRLCLADHSCLLEIFRMHLRKLFCWYTFSSDKIDFLALHSFFWTCWMPL